MLRHLTVNLILTNARHITAISKYGKNQSKSYQTYLQRWGLGGIGKSLQVTSVIIHIREIPVLLIN